MGNIGEKTIIINDKKYKIDGFCEISNTIYEFYGDIWHGNPNKFNKNLLNRFDELDKKMEINLYALKKVNDVFKQLKYSYQGKPDDFFEKTKTKTKIQETFAGNPIKLIRSYQIKQKNIFFR
jgi:hypothetical protein